MISQQDFIQLQNSLKAQQVQLVAVSKLQPIAAIDTLYQYGQRVFGENYVQELVEKQALLPQDIQWHFIGHLQSNKVKYIAPFVTLIHTIDSYKLLLEVQKQAAKNNRVIDVLLQIHIAQESTKHGMDEKELYEFLEYYQRNQTDFTHIRVCGLMGMATFTDDIGQVTNEFEKLQQLQLHVKSGWFFLQDHFNICSMGMSDDYPLAIAQGSNMIRVGSKIFGARNYN